MKYLVQIEIDGVTGLEAEAHPERIQEVVGKWQALNPLGMYMAITRRAIIVIVDVPNEDAMFEAIHATWVLAKGYPSVTPVAGADEFPSLLQRVGVLPS